MRERPSFTASAVAAARAVYSSLPPPYNLAPDPVARDLVPARFSIPARMVARAPRLAPWIHRTLGVVLSGWAQHIALRTRAIDDEVRRAVEGGIRQLVILGAGLDSRAVRMPELASLSVFEVDQPGTLRYRSQRFDALGLRSRATQVAADFERDRLAPLMVEAGFRPGERSLWICEGVTEYLEPETIGRLLRQVAALAAPHSRVAFTYMRLEDPRPWFVLLARTVASAAGEPFRAMLGEHELHEMLDAAGLTLLSDEARAEWVARYWPGEPPGRVLERLCVVERKTS